MAHLTGGPHYGLRRGWPLPFPHDRCDGCQSGQRAVEASRSVAVQFAGALDVTAYGRPERIARVCKATGDYSVDLRPIKAVISLRLVRYTVTSEFPTRVRIVHVKLYHPRHKRHLEHRTLLSFEF